MNSASEIFQFVVDRAADELPAKRIRLYRALAEVIGCSKTARDLLTIADDIEKLEHSQAQLRLNLRATTPNKAGGNRP